MMKFSSIWALGQMLVLRDAHMQHARGGVRSACAIDAARPCMRTHAWRARGTRGGRLGDYNGRLSIPTRQKNERNPERMPLGRMLWIHVLCSALLLLTRAAAGGAGGGATGTGGLGGTTVADDTYYRELGVPTDASPVEVSCTWHGAPACTRPCTHLCQHCVAWRHMTVLRLQIRKAYRKLALRWHPDKNPQQEAVAQEKFVRLANAYEVLGNAALRRVYDVNGLGRSHASAGADVQNSGFQTFRFRSAEEIFNDVFGRDDELFADFFDDDYGTVDDSVTPESAGSHVHRGHTEVTKTRTITRTSTVDGQQRSISRTHSMTNRDGITVTKRAGARMTTDGRQVKTAEIEESRPDGQRRYERRQIVDGQLKHYDARLDPDRELLHPDL